MTLAYEQITQCAELHPDPDDSMDESEMFDSKYIFIFIFIFLIIYVYIINSIFAFIKNINL